MSKGKMNGIMLNGSVKVAGVTFYTRNGQTVVRAAHSNQPKRRTRAQFEVRQRMRHTIELWRAMRDAKPIFAAGKSAYGGFATLANRLQVVYVPARGPLATAAFLLPGMPVSDGPLAPIVQSLGTANGQPALLTDMEPGSLRRSESLRLYTVCQKMEGETPKVSISVRDVVPAELMVADGHLALVGDEFADSMKGWALVRMELGGAESGDDRCSSQTVVTNCTYYKDFTTEAALKAAADSFGGLTK